MAKGLYSAHGKRAKWIKGKWKSVKGDIIACHNGFHASTNVVDAMRYVNCEVLARVEVAGEHIDDDDKQCWERMRVVESWVWTKEMSVRLAIYSATLVLENFEDKYPDDDRPRKAIQAARAYLKGTISESAAHAAAGAAWDAARSAASAAESAAHAAASAAESAARAAWGAAHAAESAARCAARSAAESAGSAARAAESAAYAAARAAQAKRKIHRFVLRMINAQHGRKE